MTHRELTQRGPSPILSPGTVLPVSECQGEIGRERWKPNSSYAVCRGCGMSLHLDSLLNRGGRIMCQALWGRVILMERRGVIESATVTEHGPRSERPNEMTAQNA